MNNTRIAILLRQLADEFETGLITRPTPNQPGKAPLGGHGQNELLKDVLPKAAWAEFEKVRMPFGKHAGSPLTEIPTDYFVWLKKNGWEGKGYDTDEPIAFAMQWSSGEQDEPETYSDEIKQPAFGEDEDVPF